MFSTSSKDIVINPLHCRIPLINIPIGMWVNLSIDVLSFVSECFKSQTFRSIDFISITANCKIRRIFSMRNALMEYDKNNTGNEEFPLEYAEILPKNLAFPSNVQHENINLNIDKLKFYIENELKQSKDFKELNSNSHANNFSNIGANINNYNINSPLNNNNQKFKKNLKNTNNNINNTPKLLKVSGGINIRSKSLNKPTKNIPNNTNEHELMNNQEFIENYSKFNSKSPSSKFQNDDYENYNIENFDPEADELLNNLALIKNKEKSINSNQSSVKMKMNNYSIKNKNKNNMRPIKLTAAGSKDKNKDKDLNRGKNIQNNIGIKNKFNNKDSHTSNTNSMLLNTLNYKNIEKWENSKDNDSIEEIYEIDEKRTVELNRELE
jgi:hypothetical protein